jgi:Zn-dependent protease with chaperone function
MNASASRQEAIPALLTDTVERLCELYARVRFRFSLLEMALLLLLLIGAGATGLAHGLDEALNRFLPPGFAHIGLYLFLAVLVLRLALLPLHWAAHYRLDRRFKLLHQDPWSWLRDWALVSFLFAGLTALFLTPVVFTLKWWPWLLIPWILIYIALRAFFYQWLFLPIVSLFYPVRFLRAESFYLPGIGRRVMPVYEVEVSAKTRRMNACVLLNRQGGTVLVTDTLIDAFNDAEERVAIAHEFGHLYDHLFLEEQTEHGLAQSRRKVLLTAGGLLIAAAASLGAMEFLAPLLGFSGVADLAATPLEAALMLCCTHVLAPFTNAESRADEREADEFALRITRDPESYLSVMSKLRRVNLQESTPCFLDHSLFGDHPTYLERLRMGLDYRERFAEDRPARRKGKG